LQNTQFGDPTFGRQIPLDFILFIMPLVFVHGVNVRNGPEYEKDVATRTELLRRLFLEPLGRAQGICLDKILVNNVYWGMHGVSFAWGNACLPDLGTLKHMGALDGATPFGDAELQRVITEVGRDAAAAGITPMDAPVCGLKAAAKKDPAKVAEAILSPVIFGETKCDGQDALTPEENGKREALLLIAAALCSRNRAVLVQTGNL
jgi:hypothetical protein